VYKLVHATEATVIADHRLRIRFEDGIEGEIDFSGMHWNGVFAPLEDPSYFAQARIDIGTVVWPNDADIAPETLYHWVTARTGPDGDF